MYHMVTGRRPFEGEEPSAVREGHVSGFLPDPREINSSIAISTARLISKLMMKTPEARYPDWRAARAEIGKAAAGRVVLIRHSPDAVSTVRPPETPAGTAAGERPATPSVPLWFRLPVWALLALWFVFLGHRTFAPRRKPVAGPAPAKPDTPAPAATPRPSAPTVSSSDPEPVPVSPGLESRSTEPAPRPARSAADDAEELDMLKTVVARCLIDGDYDKASSVIDQAFGNSPSPSLQKGLEQLKQLAHDGSAIDAAVLAVFGGMVGQEVVVNYNYQNLKIVVQSIVNDEVRGRWVTKTGTKPVSFSVGRLDPLERSRLLGEADTPAKHVMKFLLHMRGGDVKSARTFAAGCGVLSDAFAQLASAPQGSP
jgi:hypothetical protein